MDISTLDPSPAGERKPDSAVTAAEPPFGAPLTVKTIPGRDWDVLLARFDDVSFEQSALYAAHRWGDGKVECLAVHDGAAVVGGAVLIRIRLPLLGGLAHLKFGPVWRPLGIAATPERYAAVVTALRDHVAAEGLALNILPRPHPVFAALEGEQLQRLGFSRTEETVDADRFLVDAALPADEQAASLGQTWRSNLRKSEKAGLDIADLDFADYSEFVAIYDRMAQRKQVTLYGPVDVVPELRATLPEDMRPLGIIARHGGEAVAGVIYARIGDMAYYMFGATNDKALPVRAGYALQWAVLDKLRGTTRWYDLGGAPEPGLRQFKSGFVGKAGVVVTLPGEFHYAAGPRAKLALHLISALRITRSFVRTTLKSLRRLGRPAKAAPGPSAPAA
jgi:hypothetical protein